MDVKELKQDINVAMSDAVELGLGNGAAASAYYLEAIAKMMYFMMFHENYEYVNPNEVSMTKEVDEDETTESTDI